MNDLCKETRDYFYFNTYVINIRYILCFVNYETFVSFNERIL